jgi:hypothetical protein
MFSMQSRCSEPKTQGFPGARSWRGALFNNLQPISVGTGMARVLLFCRRESAGWGEETLKCSHDANGCLFWCKLGRMASLVFFVLAGDCWGEGDGANVD